MKNLENLKKSSLAVTEGMEIINPFSQRVENLYLKPIIRAYDNSFSIYNKAICFIDHEEVFVTPYNRKSASLLQEAGLTRRSFHVPFSNGDHPKDESKYKEWLRLYNRGIKVLVKEFEEDCEKWSDDHGIHSLPEEDLGKCLRIPSHGVLIKNHEGSVGKVMPVCNEKVLDSIDVNYLSTYSTKNNTVVFVYRNGHTYVSPALSGIGHALQQAGYRDTVLYIPFSDGEVILDQSIATAWQYLVEKYNNLLE